MNPAPFSLAAVVVAAGSSRRMGFDKLSAPLAGRPLLAHSLAAFQRCPEVEKIILVCAAERVAEFSWLKTEFPKVSTLIPGGEERRDSVRRGLEALSAGAGKASRSPSETSASLLRPIRLQRIGRSPNGPAFDPQSAAQNSFVAIHDGARPLITPGSISACYQMARQVGAASCAEPETDTLHRADDELRLVENVPRRNLWRMQTPQIFGYHTLLDLLERESSASATDEVSSWLQSGAVAKIYETPEENFKITRPRDLTMAEHILKTRPL